MSVLPRRQNKKESFLMRTKKFPGIFLLVFSFIVLSGCQRPGDDTNRAAPNTNSARETVDTAAIESELKRIEQDWPRVMKEKDAAAVQRVEADDVMMVYPDGSIGGKAQDLKDIESGALSADSWEVTDLNVTVLDNDSAVVSGRSVVKGGKYKTSDGKTIDISGQYRFIDTFARRNGEWKLVASASTPIRDVNASASPGAAASPTPRTSPTAKASPTVRPSPAAKASPLTSPAVRPTP
jgi:ketosteroid isomerase-like protein